MKAGATKTYLQSKKEFDDDKESNEKFKNKPRTFMKVEASFKKPNDKTRELEAKLEENELILKYH